MRISFAILAATATLLLAVVFVLGLMLEAWSGSEARDVLYAKHVIAGVGGMLFVCFVHVVAYTYFVVYARMAKDAVDTAGLEPGGYLEIVELKRRAVRWLVAGIVPLMASGISGALAVPPAGVPRQWHLAA